MNVCILAMQTNVCADEWYAICNLLQNNKRGDGSLGWVENIIAMS